MMSGMGSESDFEHGGTMFSTVFRPDQPEPGQWIKFRDAGVEVGISRMPKDPGEDPAIPYKTHVFVRKLRPGDAPVTHHTWRIDDDGVQLFITEDTAPPHAAAVVADGSD